MKKIYSISEMQAVVYWCPGETLDDLSLKKLHLNMQSVNEYSGANIKHRMLMKGTPLVELREMFKYIVISEFFMEGQSRAFLISPMLKNNQESILHTGLMVIEKNPGGNLMGLLFLINATLTFEKLGSYFVTNISSTPSAIENFAELVPHAWPGPDEQLKKAPRGHDKILRILKEQYLDLYFPATEKIALDFKRFIMTSDSQGMGFKTDFYKVSRAVRLKYNLFCKLWINYDNEEDVIQVGKVGLFTYLRMKVLLLVYKYQLSALTKNTDVKTMDLGLETMPQSQDKAS
jgi:hypothetical protein